jgi:hypothetical protein
MSASTNRWPSPPARAARARRDDHRAGPLRRPHPHRRRRPRQDDRLRHRRGRSPSARSGTSSSRSTTSTTSSRRTTSSSSAARVAGAPARPAAGAGRRTGEPTVQRFYRVNNDVEQVVDPAPAVPASRRRAAGHRRPRGRRHRGAADESSSVLGRVRPAGRRGAELEQRTYFLSNANAADLATDARGDARRGANGRGGHDHAPRPVHRRRRAAHEQPHRHRHRRVQAAWPSSSPELDEPQPQVNIQVRIQEITRAAPSTSASTGRPASATSPPTCSAAA